MPAEFDASPLELFPTTAWLADFSFLASIREHLIEDAWELLRSPLEGQPGLQTPSTLQTRTEPWWQECFAAITAFTDAIAVDLRPPWRERTLFSWALGYRNHDDYTEYVGNDPVVRADKALQAQIGLGHTHTAATFTTVLYLQVPEEMVSTGATVIRNPNYTLHHRLGAHVEHRVLPKVLQLLVFPGYLEHYPEPADLDGEWSEPRLVLSSDICYY